MFKKALDGAQTQERGAVSEENDSVQYAISDEEEIEPDELTQYNRFGWFLTNDVLTKHEWDNVTSGINAYRNHNVVWKKNKDGELIVQTWDRNNDLAVIAITDDKPIYPTVSRVYRMRRDEDPDFEKKLEERILNDEQRWGYDALTTLGPLRQLGGFEIYNFQDYRAFKYDEIPERFRSYRKKDSELSSNLQNGRRGNSEAGRGGAVSDENVQRSIDDSVLPDDDYLLAEIEEWKRGSGDITSEPLTSKTGDRQFATKTIQQNAYVPDYIKQTFLNDPTRREYSRESNMEQLARA